MTTPDFFVLLATSVAAVAAVWDVWTRRIPNELTFGASALALGWHLWSGGVAGLGWGVLGWVTGLAVFLPLFLLRGMGGGDIKLMAALGACVGAKTVLWLAVLTAIAGGALAIVVALGHGYLRTAATNVGRLLNSWRLAGVQPLPELTLETGTGPRLAYAVPILVGTVATIWGRL